MIAVQSGHLRKVTKLKKGISLYHYMSSKMPSFSLCYNLHLSLLGQMFTDFHDNKSDIWPKMKFKKVQATCFLFWLSTFIFLPTSFDANLQRCSRVPVEVTRDFPSRRGGEGGKHA